MKTVQSVIEKYTCWFFFPLFFTGNKLCWIGTEAVSRLVHMYVYACRFQCYIVVPDQPCGGRPVILVGLRAVRDDSQAGGSLGRRTGSVQTCRVCRNAVGNVFRDQFDRRQRWKVIATRYATLSLPVACLITEYSVTIANRKLNKPIWRPYAAILCW